MRKILIVGSIFLSFAACQSKRADGDTTPKQKEIPCKEMKHPPCDKPQPVEEKSREETCPYKEKPNPSCGGCQSTNDQPVEPVR